MMMQWTRTTMKSGPLQNNGDTTGQIEQEANLQSDEVGGSTKIAKQCTNKGGSFINYDTPTQ